MCMTSSSASLFNSNFHLKTSNLSFPGKQLRVKFNLNFRLEWAFQKFGHSDTTINEQNIALSLQLYRCSYKPFSEPNTCGFSDDSYPLWIYLMSCEYANSSYEYWHNSTANKTPVGSGPSPREGLGMRLKCILSVASQLAPARRVLWHHLEVGKTMADVSTGCSSCHQKWRSVNKDYQLWTMYALYTVKL